MELLKKFIMWLVVVSAFTAVAVILAAVAFGEVRRNKEYQAETKRLGTECQNVGTAYDGTTDEKVRTIYKCSDGKLIIR